MCVCVPYPSYYRYIPACRGLAVFFIRGEQFVLLARGLFFSREVTFTLSSKDRHAAARQTNRLLGVTDDSSGEAFLSRGARMKTQMKRSQNVAFDLVSAGRGAAA